MRGVQVEAPNDTGRQPDGEASIDTYSYGYAESDSEGNFKTHPSFKYERRSMRAEETAIIVMDPWRDTWSAEIDSITKQHMEECILPIVEHALEEGMLVIVLTNAPGATKNTDKIDERLERLEEKNKIVVLHHQIYNNSKAFCELLLKQGIKNLIYTGYSTHICVTCRPTGVMGIFFSEFKGKFQVYIIPEATMSFMNLSERDNSAMTIHTVIMCCSNKCANVITLEDFWKYRNKEKSEKRNDSNAVHGFQEGTRIAKSKKDKFHLYYELLNDWLELKQEGKKIDSYFENNKYKKIAVYGRGKIAEHLIKELENADVKIVYFIENGKVLKSNGEREEKQGLTEIFSDIDAIIITPIFAKEQIEKMLREDWKINMPIISMDEVINSMADR